MASFNSQTDDGDDEVITRELQQAVPPAVPSMDDGSDVDLETGEVRVGATCQLLVTWCRAPAEDGLIQ